MLGIIIQLNQCLSVGTNNKFWGEPKECQTTNPNHEAMAECEPRRGHGKRTPIRKDWLENPLGRPWTKKIHLMSLGKQRQTAANPVLYIILVAVQQQQQQQNKTKQKKELMWGCSPPHFLGSCSDPYPSQMGMDQKWKPPPTKIDLHKLARICGRFKPLNFDPCRMYCPPPMPGAFPRMSARGIQSTAVQPASSRYADSPWRGSSNGLKVAKRLKLQMTRTPTFSINLVGGLAQVGIDF